MCASSDCRKPRSSDHIPFPPDQYRINELFFFSFFFLTLSLSKVTSYVFSSKKGKEVLVEIPRTSFQTALILPKFTVRPFKKACLRTLFSRKRLHMKTMEEKYSLFKSKNVYVSVQVISDVKRFVLRFTEVLGYLFCCQSQARFFYLLLLYAMSKCKFALN